jgi:hypothetical protein
MIKIRPLILCLAALILMGGCYLPDEPRPMYMLDNNVTLTSEKLEPYASPPCTLGVNAIECSFLNYNFEITDVKLFGKDSIIAWEKDNPSNKVVIRFSRLLDQDGIYAIREPYNGNLTLINPQVILSGNKFEKTILTNNITKGKLYLKDMGSKYDLVICNADFYYRLNEKLYTGLFSAHFVVSK